MTYKKLFNIKYNNKTFAIFIDENNRRTFLEVDENGEYAYPNIEDFTELHAIYNNRNPFICYNVKKFTFKEKVRMTSMILAAVIATSYAIESINSRGLTINDVTNVVEVGIATLTNSYVEIKDLSELDAILGYKTISKEEIERAIDNNDNLTPDLKAIAHQELDDILREYPNTDLRIFYENIKTLNVYVFQTIEDLQKAQKLDNIAGSYNAVTNTIYLYEGVSEEVKKHEMKHAFHNFYRKINDKIIAFFCKKGHSLDEAMTNKLIGMETSTYKNEGAILDYFLTCVDYDFYDYNNKGIWDLIYKLEQQYPDVDIDYIINCLDSLTDTRLKIGEYKYLDESPDLLDELFLLATKQIDLTVTDVYEPFYSFMGLFEYVQNKELFFEYLTKYNEELMCLGYPSIKDVEDIRAKLEACKNFSGIAYTYNYVNPVMVTEEHENYAIQETVDIYGNIIDNPNLNYSTKPINNMSQLLQPLIIKNSETYGTQEFWQNFALSNNLVHEYQINEIPILNNGNYITKEYIGNISVQFGTYENGKVGYLLTNKNGEIIYSDCKSIPNTFSNLSDRVAFSFFFAEDIENKDFHALELSEFLTEANIKREVTSYPSLYERVSLINGELFFHPAYKLTLKDYDGEYTIMPSEIILSQAGNSIVITINSNDIYIPIKNVAEFNLNQISLEQVLLQTGFLNENVEEYTLTIQELSSILNNYIEELGGNRAR